MGIEIPVTKIAAGQIKPPEYHFPEKSVQNHALVEEQDAKTELTKKEILLMKLLIENTNQVVSREHILKVVWDYTVIPNTRTIDNFILSLRKHFERDPKNPEFIQSVRGVGYKFVA